MKTLQELLIVPVVVGAALGLGLACSTDEKPDVSTPYVPLRGPVNYRGNTIYELDVSIGTPPQTVALALDTGSSTLIVNAADCADCKKWTPGAPRFDSAKSSTWESTSCNEQNCPAPVCPTPESCEPVQGCLQCYADGPDCQFCAYYENNFGQNIGNWGIWGSDMVRVGQVETRVNLGLTEKYYNKDSGYGEHVSGIFGMQLEEFNNVLADRNKPYPSFMNAAAGGSGLTGLPYSLCLTDDGGTLLLGEKDVAHMVPGTEKIVPYGKGSYDESQAIADFDAFSVNGAALKGVDEAFYKKYPVDFDSGTGPWTMLDTFYDALGAQFCEGSTDAAACEGVRVALFKHECLALDSAQMASLPELNSVIGGQEFTLQGTQYLLKGELAKIVTTDRACAADEYVLGFASTPASTIPAFWVSLFGAVWMRNFTMYFDTPNKQVVIAGQRDCVVR